MCVFEISKYPLSAVLPVAGGGPIAIFIVTYQIFIKSPRTLLLTPYLRHITLKIHKIVKHLILYITTNTYYAPL